MSAGTTPPAVAYSYLRFSTADQVRGDSVRRQEELRDAWLARNPGVRFDTSLSLRDQGTSGFTGEHRRNPDRHALAAFLQLVEKGRIPRGSYLIVENLDRLSREHIRPALTLLLNLIEAGVRVVQLLPAEQVFDEHVEPMALMMAIMELSRGHSESRMKSERIGRAWRAKKERARAGGEVVTPIVPSWLRVDGGRVVEVPERAAVVRRIFRDVVAGLGMIQVAKRLTSEGVPTFGRSAAWNPSTVHKIVHSRAAVGEYQPRTKKDRAPDGDPIPGYYPAVVDDQTWWAAQDALRVRHLGGGRRAVRQYNPFSGLLVDARDGSKIHMVCAGKKSKPTLVSYSAARGRPGAVYVSFPLRPFVESVLGHLRELSPADVLLEGDEGGLRLAEQRAKVATLERRIADLRAELESGEGEVRSAVASLRSLEGALEREVAKLAAEEAKAASPLAASLADCQTLIDLTRRHGTDDVRTRLKGAVARLVAEVRCLFVVPTVTPVRVRGKAEVRSRSRLAAVQVRFRNGDRHRDYLISYKQSVGNAQRKQPARCESWSFAAAGLDGGLDLRDPDHARRLEAALARLAPAGGAPRD